jgi:hypothetical protein
VHFVPGFPVMAWPMVEWVLDNLYPHFFRKGAYCEQSVIVFGAMEATLTPLMESIERDHPVKVFSLPSVDHPEYGRHIELGVKGEPAACACAASNDVWRPQVGREPASWCRPWRRPTMHFNAGAAACLRKCSIRATASGPPRPGRGPARAGHCSEGEP